MRRTLMSALVAAVSTVVGSVGVVPAASAAAPTPGTVAAAVTKLRVAPEAARSGYSRASFRHWVDADRDCRDTRAEVLHAERKAPLGWAGCRVTTGRWFSYVDGVTWTVAGDVDIDHTVALAEAWDSGARGWRAARREAFANDLGFAHSLVAITDDVNASKADRDPAEWLPPRARCSYVARWIAVKYRWDLAVDSAERAALGRFAAGPCGSTRLALPPRAPATPAPPPPSAPPPRTPSNPGDTKNCSDFATQAAAQRWFDTYYPRYGDVARLDADGDRIACESLP